MIKQVNESDQISRLVLRGYKSIAYCDLELSRLNVLIGANGAGRYQRQPADCPLQAHPRRHARLPEDPVWPVDRLRYWAGCDAGRVFALFAVPGKIESLV